MNALQNITLQQLASLISLIEKGSFTRAAEGLHISQSTLTKQIQNMEEAAGTRLVNRGSAGITLTAEGRLVYDYAKRVTRLQEDVRDRMEQIRNQDSGHIYMAASTTPATYILPSLLARLLPELPNITAHIKMHDSDEALQMVLNNQAEIGFIGKAALNRKVISERLCKDKLVLAVPSHHRLAGQKSVTVAELAREAFVLRERGSGTRAIFEDSLHRNSGGRLSDFNVICELGSTEAVKEAVLAGLGVSVLSIFSLKRELEQGLLKILEIGDCPMERHFYIIYRKDFPLKKHHRMFLEVIKKLSDSLSA